MKSFIVYNATGKILRTGTCADTDIVLQAGDGEQVIEGVANDATQMVVDHEVVDRPPTPPPSHDELNQTALEDLRIQRDKRLFSSDYTQFPDSPLSETKKTEWVAYRQALRDLPQNNPDITSTDDIVWPTPPSSGS